VEGGGGVDGRSEVEIALSVEGAQVGGGSVAVASGKGGRPSLHM
jgi:hypothetical protein